MDANGLDPEQQALLASIMGKSPQAGGGAAFSAAQVAPAAAPSTPDNSAPAGDTSAPAAAPAAKPSAPPDPGRMLSQREIDALIASMLN